MNRNSVNSWMRKKLFLCANRIFINIYYYFAFRTNRNVEKKYLKIKEILILFLHRVFCSWYAQTRHLINFLTLQQFINVDVLFEFFNFCIEKIWQTFWMAKWDSEDWKERKTSSNESNMQTALAQSVHCDAINHSSFAFFYGILIPNAIKRMPWIEEDEWNDAPFSKVKCEMYERILCVLESFKIYIKIIKYLRRTRAEFPKLLLLFLFLFFIILPLKRILMWIVKLRRSSVWNV